MKEKVKQTEDKLCCSSIYNITASVMETIHISKNVFYFTERDAEPIDWINSFKKRSFRLCKRRTMTHPRLLSPTRKNRSDIRLKTPLTAGEYTEYSSLLQVMGAAITVLGSVWKNFIDTTLNWQTWRRIICGILKVEIK